MTLTEKISVILLVLVSIPYVSQAMTKVVKEDTIVATEEYIDSINQPSMIRCQILDTAKQYLGVRYARGGQSENGFDCSGFVRYVYSKLGIEIPRNSASQFLAGKTVGKDSINVGDLVFFRCRGHRNISHVGIYIGDDKFIHSPRRGKSVSISSLNEPYWRNKFYKSATYLVEN
ncbi:MAG: C40 family peptidase [Bacteroidota bacterium]|nr:C40 family peptidase [Bacteroidota bacterium]MDP4226510.1 C40 family peptidase [Bacteroidota bacterium]MDP4273174.1 C40 family peptidase [Bacteroidota bacterium]